MICWKILNPKVQLKHQLSCVVLDPCSRVLVAYVVVPFVLAVLRCQNVPECIPSRAIFASYHIVNSTQTMNLKTSVDSIES